MCVGVDNQGMRFDMRNNMAYSFPPRGFSKPVHNHQFPPQFSMPQFPPPRQPTQGCPPPPMDCSGWGDRPQIHGGAPQFVPGPSVRCPRPNAPHARAAGPSNRGAWTGVRAAGPRAPHGQFPQRFVGNGTRQQRPMGPWSQHPDHNNVMSSDITECESWPGLPGRKRPHGQQNPPGPSVPRQQQQGNKNQGPQGKHAKRGKRGGKKKQNKQGAPSSQDPNASGQYQLEEYCDICDRTFKTTALLDDHIKQHVKCNHPGCRYEAHFKIVKLHQKLQHGPGSKKVAWLDTPTEVNKWRAERKRNYPTDENIARKREVIKTKQEKGDVLQNKYFGKMRKPKRKHQGPSEDREVVPAKKENLGSLAALATYDDSEEEEEEGEIQEDTPTPKAVASPKKSPAASFRENKRGRWQASRGGKKSRRGTKAGKSVQEKREKERQARLRKRPNLLEMLLAPEIRRERNTILQCVRYVVKNNFFDASGTKKEEGQVPTLESGKGSCPGTDGESENRESGMDKEVATEELVSGDLDQSSSGRDEICGRETGSQEPGCDAERTSTLEGSAVREDATSGNCQVPEVSVEDVPSQRGKEAEVEDTSDQGSSRPVESHATEEGEACPNSQKPETESAQDTNDQMPSTCVDSPTNMDSNDLDKSEIKPQETNTYNSVEDIKTVLPDPQPDMNGDGVEDSNKPTSNGEKTDMPQSDIPKQELLPNGNKAVVSMATTEA